MSLIKRIRYQQLQDSLNEGWKLSLTGTMSSDGTDMPMETVSGELALLITGITLTSDSATPCLVSLGFKKGTDPTAIFFHSYVSSTGPVVRSPEGLDWYRGHNEFDLVMTISGLAGNLAYTIDARRTSDKEPLGYIEHIGTPNHESPRFPDENAANRGTQVI